MVRFSKGFMPTNEFSKAISDASKIPGRLEELKLDNPLNVLLAKDIELKRFEKLLKILSDQSLAIERINVKLDRIFGNSILFDGRFIEIK